jgi:hypothetical protein
MIHFSTGDAGMRFDDEPLDVGAVIESGAYEVWRVEQPRAAEGLGHAWARLTALTHRRASCPAR